jgi:D-3-phosphoglycerate dehydrogenase / 2-oxoglutarate reductase
VVVSKHIVIRVDRAGASEEMIEEKAVLAEIEAELYGANCITEDEMIKAARDADVIITEEARITRRVMENLPKCQAIVRYGVGYDTLDVEAATDNHILIINIPDYCFEEVANQAFALLFACAKKLLLLDTLVKQGRWFDAKRALPPMGAIYGQTLGIVGCGNIGRTVARKAQCFGFKILGYDPYVDRSLTGEAGIAMIDNISELLRVSDYVTLHPLLNQETRHMIGEKELKQMKAGAYLINTSRGPVVDEAALIKALQNGWIAGAGLDVLEHEPTDPHNPLLKMNNIIVFPHSAYYSDIANKRLRTSVGQEAARVISGKWPKNPVNKNVKPRASLVKGDS